jgi:hypothetical protein
VQWLINEVQSKKEMKLLGITFHASLSRTINENWKEKMKNLTGRSEALTVLPFPTPPSHV